MFRIEQDNVGQSTGVPIAGSNGDTAYRAMDGTVSKGVEFEVNGAITDNWQMTFGATRYVAEDNEGNAVKPEPTAYHSKTVYPLSPASHAGTDRGRWG